MGFDPWVRDDGLHGNGWDGDYGENDGPYNRYLKEKGMTGQPVGNLRQRVCRKRAAGLRLVHENADKPANIREEDSETPWLTREAIRFIDQPEARGARMSASSSRTGPISCRRPITTCTGRTTSSR